MNWFKRCGSTKYCDGNATPPGKLNDIICGANNMKYQCQKQNKQLRWVNMGKSCDPGQAHQCLLPCHPTKYCDGVSTAMGKDRDTVCGTNNIVLQCKGSTGMWTPGNQCDMNMAHRCGAAPATAPAPVVANFVGNIGSSEDRANLLALVIIAIIAFVFYKYLQTK